MKGKGVSATEKIWQEYEEMLANTDWDYRRPTVEGTGRSKRFIFPSPREIEKHHRHFVLLRQLKKICEEADPERAKALLVKYQPNR